MESVTRYLHSFPLNSDYVATLPWKVKSPKFVKNYNSKIILYVIK